MKVKYSWRLMHGDADHYDNESLILTNENDIAFFDCVIKLKFESHSRRGFMFINDSEYEIFIELFKKTTKYKKYCLDANDDELYYEILEYLDDIDYIVSDVTCNNHYADISYVNRTEIKETDKIKDSDLLKYAIELLNISKENLIKRYNNK